MEKLTLERLVHQFQQANRAHFTGRLTVRSHTNPAWNLYFRLGRFVWSDGGEHRFRRWYRLLNHICPELDSKTIQLRESEMTDHWEYTAIAILVKRQQMTREQAVTLSEQAVLEVLFDIFQSFGFSEQVTCAADQQVNLGEPLAVFNLDQTLSKAQQLWQNWCSLGLSPYSPNLAPHLKDAATLQQRTSSNSYVALEKMLNGRTTLRELAVLMKRDPLTVTRSFLPYLKQGLITLHVVADFPNPYASTPKAELLSKAGSTTAQPLIFCIDDSLQLCQSLEQILVTAGYRFVSVQDSLLALPMLLERKPDLIFLDLVMPIANGYEICAQIRRVSAFKSTPIVILTGNDGIVDRVRAKVVGASDFLAKPIQTDKVLAVIRKHLATGLSPSLPLDESSPNVTKFSFS